HYEYREPAYLDQEFPDIPVTSLFSPYAFKRLYSVLTLTPNTSAAFFLLFSNCFRVPAINSRSTSSIVLPIRSLPTLGERCREKGELKWEGRTSVSASGSVRI